MTLGQRIYEFRKRAGITQEELADRLGVSRQAVSKWESDAAYPETDKLKCLCGIFSVTADELLFGGETERKEEIKQAPTSLFGSFHYEYVSERKIFGMPLVHINVGLGFYRAHGFFAVGNIATGIFSFGALAAGVVSFGALAVGILALGALVLGGLALGAIALGLLSLGGIAVGVFAIGGLSVGYLAFGGLAVGQFALGDVAYGFCAVGESRARGTHTFLIGSTAEEREACLQSLSVWLDANVSPSLSGTVRFLAELLTLSGA